MPTSPDALPYFQLAAFSSAPFHGNPAGICILPHWPSDETLLAITSETRMPVTAFIVAEDGGLSLRWFTAIVEEDMCGHGTLAAAAVVFNHLDPTAQSVTFKTRAGLLAVRRQGQEFVLDLPAGSPREVPAKPEIAAALGITPAISLVSTYNIAVLARGEDVAALQPNFDLVAKLDRPGLIVTAPGDRFNCDIVTRYFLPAKGIDEDAVTGSAHAQIVPYWSKRLNKSVLHARQLSARGGSMICEDLGTIVRITASVCTIAEGELLLGSLLR